MNLKRTTLALGLLALLTACSSTKKQPASDRENKYNWFNFYWQGATLSGKHFPKLAMLVPARINSLNVNFELQFDLGANTSILYGKPLRSYYTEEEVKKWLIESTKEPAGGETTYYDMRDLELHTGNFRVKQLSYRENYGSPILKDSLFTASPKHVGSLGADAFKDKILVIDFPNKKMCVLDSLDDFWRKRTTFVQARSARGRLHIPLRVDARTYWFLFDTGASLFPINTNKRIWEEITDSQASTDTLRGNSWGEKVSFFGRPIAKKVYLGDKLLNKNYAWYNENKRLMDFNEQEKIDGLAGNAYFFEEVVLLDFKANKFGLVKR